MNSILNLLLQIFSLRHGTISYKKMISKYGDLTKLLIISTLLVLISFTTAIPLQPSNQGQQIHQAVSGSSNSTTPSNQTIAPQPSAASNRTDKPAPTSTSNHTAAPDQQKPINPPVKCPHPLLITPDYGYGMKYPWNSKYAVDSPGSTFSFFCHSDFNLVPTNPFRKCEDNGTWSGEPHKCIVDKSARCADPVLPEHSFPKNPMEEFPIFSVLQMDCEEGWVGRGNLTVQCDHRKTWSIDFQCQEGCSLETLPEHSLLGSKHEYLDIAVNETVPVACELGYHLLGVPEVSCNSSKHLKVQFGCCPDQQTYENMRNIYYKRPEYFYGPILMLMALVNIALVIKLVHRKKIENKIISADMIKVRPAKGMSLENEEPISKTKGPSVKEVRLQVQMRTVTRNPVAHENSPYRKISRDDTF